VPHDLFDRMREEAPVHPHGEIAGQNVWSLTRLSDIQEVSRDVRRFSSARGTVFPNVRARWERAAGPIADMAFSDPPLHTRLRGYASRAFSPSVMRTMRGWIEEVVAGVLDVAQQQHELDIVRDISEQLPSRVITGLLGVPLDEREWVIETSNRTFSSSNPEIGPAGALAAREEILAYALRMRALRRAEPADDMTTELTRAESDGEPITEEEFANIFLALLSAGFETTHSLLTHSLLLFTRRPELLEPLRDAPDQQWAAAVEELLRVNAPISHMARTVTEATEIGGRELAAGDYVITWFAAANHDPAGFERPSEVDFARRPRHTTFGAGGPHLCLGNQLARLESRVMLSEFAKRGLRLELTAEPRRAANIFLNAVSSAPAVWG
jgi:cholest-4-en-3-one 26-monooxygenase